MSNRKLMGGTIPPEMRPTIKKAEDKGMEQLGWTFIEQWMNPEEDYSEDVPDWLEVPERFGLSGSRGEYITVN